MKKVSKNSGFTLIELMVAVAIVGILASMAIPSYYSFQIQAARAEMKQNLNTIASLMEVYHSEHDEYFYGDGFPAGWYGNIAGTLNCGAGGDPSLAGSIGFRVPGCDTDMLRYSYLTAGGSSTAYVVDAMSLQQGAATRYGNPPISRLNCTGNNYYDLFNIDQNKQIRHGSYRFPFLGTGDAIASCNK